MVVSDDACVMLLVRPFFGTFTTKDVTDAVGATEAVLAVSAESRRRSTPWWTRRSRSAARPPRTRRNKGFMYGRNFYDLDGHAWEVMSMDPATVR